VDYLAVSLKPASQTATVDRAVTMELARWNCGIGGTFRSSQTARSGDRADRLR